MYGDFEVVILIVCSGFVIMGAIFCITSVCIQTALDRKKKNCISQAEGVVLKMKRERTRIHPGVGRVPIITYYPVYAYHVGPEKIVKKSHFGYSKPIFEEGQRITIHYDPFHPECHYVGEMNVSRLARIFLIIGVVLLLVSAFVSIIGVKILSLYK